MNALYTVMLFLFTFGIVTGTMNTLGVFDTALPPYGATVNDSQVTDLQSGALTTPLNVFNAFMIPIMFLRIIGQGVLALFVVAPMLHDYMTMFGAPDKWAWTIALMVQAPLTLITIFGLYEWWTGRQVS